MTVPRPVAREASRPASSGLGGERCRQVISDGHTRLHRRSARVARESQQTGHGDGGQIEAGAARIGTRLPKHRDPHRHEPVRQVSRTEPPTFERAGSEVLAEHIGRADEPPGQVLTAAIAEVARDAASTPAFHCEEQRCVTVEGADPPKHVTALWILNLDHLGPQLAEDPGAVRCGDTGSHVDDTKAGERRAAAHGLACEPGGRLCFHASTAAGCSGSWRDMASNASDTSRISLAIQRT